MRLATFLKFFQIYFMSAKYRKRVKRQITRQLLRLQPRCISCRITLVIRTAWPFGHQHYDTCWPCVRSARLLILALKPARRTPMLAGRGRHHKVPGTLGLASIQVHQHDIDTSTTRYGLEAEPPTALRCYIIAQFGAYSCAEAQPCTKAVASHQRAPSWT